MTTRRDLAFGVGASTLLAASPALAQARRRSAAELDDAIAPIAPGHDIIPLWRRIPGAPRTPPVQQIEERSSTPATFHDRSVAHTARPVLVAHRAAQPTGAAVLVMPGGGYRRVVFDKEGYEIAANFNAAGITCFTLIYRLPEDGWAQRSDAALQDAQRAIRIIRSRASEYAIDPARLGVIGFSAGGHLAGSLSLRFDRPTYPRADAADDLSARPDVSMLLYPVITMEAAAHAGSRDALLGAGASDELKRADSLEYAARPDAPPTFFAHAGDDTAVPIANSLMLYQALRAANVPAELHAFEVGGHGFGIRQTIGKPVAAWPGLAVAWLRAHGL